MSKNQKKRGKDYYNWFKDKHKYHEEGQYFIMPCNIWKSLLFKKAPSSAKVVYSEFRNRCFKGRENIIFSYKDARKLNLGHKTFKRALGLLEEHGFIKCTQIGFLTNSPSLYSLSSDWYSNEILFKSNPEKYLRQHFPQTIKRKEIMNKARKFKKIKSKNEYIKQALGVTV